MASGRRIAANSTASSICWAQWIPSWRRVVSSMLHAIGFRVKDLKKYNEVPEDFPLQKNDIVYLEKKKKKADKPNYDHVVQVGESMHSIAQKYGIQIKSLYKMNKKHKDYIPEEGDVLKLR